MKKICAILLVVTAIVLLFAGYAAADRIVSSGDTLEINGEAQGDPGTLRYYVFGTNSFSMGSVSVDDARYTIKVNTAGLSPGDYIIVIQHPMYDKQFNVQVSNTGNGLTAKVYPTMGNGRLADEPKEISAIPTRQNANAVIALETLINLEYHDDLYLEEKFTVTSPVLYITGADDNVIYGRDFTITGTTNLKPDTLVTIEITSTNFEGIGKTGVSDSSSLTLPTRVVRGANGINTWTVAAHNPRLAPGEYRIVAVTPNDGPSDAGKFTIVAASASTAVPTPAQTAHLDVPVSTETTAPASTDSPASPGFGALAAFLGLGFAGFLRLRR